MRRGHRERLEELNPGFDWCEIVCDSEAAAKSEAERKQAYETNDEAEWIYLRPRGTGQWIARRTPRDLKPPEVSIGRAFLELIANPFEWLGR